MSTLETEARRSHRPLIWCACLLAVMAIWFAFPGKKQIGAIVEVTEVSSGITFDSRVDTGAAVSSVHYEEMVIENESNEPRENRGKEVRFLIDDGKGQHAWITADIVDYSKIKSVDATTGRYYVRLPLRCAGIEKQTLVTLNDRTRMNHKLLLGRSFLEGDFVVDVSR